MKIRNKHCAPSASTSNFEIYLKNKLSCATKQHIFIVILEVQGQYLHDRLSDSVSAKLTNFITGNWIEIIAFTFTSFYCFIFSSLTLGIVIMMCVPINLTIIAVDRGNEFLMVK